METVNIKWEIMFDKRYDARVSGIIQKYNHKNVADIVLVYHTILVIVLAMKNCGRLKPLENIPSMHNRVVYFEVSFKNKSDLFGFIEAVVKGSK